MRIPYISALAAGALALGGCADYYGLGYGGGYYGGYGGYGSPYVGCRLFERLLQPRLWRLRLRLRIAVRLVQRLLLSRHRPLCLRHVSATARHDDDAAYLLVEPFARPEDEQHGPCPRELERFRPPNREQQVQSRPDALIARRVPPSQPGRRRISTIEVKVITGTSSWLVTVVCVRNEPISGLLRESVFSTICPRTWSVSPG